MVTTWGEINYGSSSECFCGIADNSVETGTVGQRFEISDPDCIWEFSVLSTKQNPGALLQSLAQMLLHCRKEAKLQFNIFRYEFWYESQVVLMHHAQCLQVMWDWCPTSWRCCFPAQSSPSWKAPSSCTLICCVAFFGMVAATQDWPVQVYYNSGIIYCVIWKDFICTCSPSHKGSQILQSIPICQTILRTQWKGMFYSTVAMTFTELMHY